MSSNTRSEAASATLSVPISLLWRLRRLRQCTGSTACLISTATHSQSRDIPTDDPQPCVPQDTDCGALFRLRVCLWFCHQTLTAALICLGRAEDLQMRGRRLQPCRIDWTAVARYPCCEALDVTVAKTDFTWPWHKLCKNLRGCASRLHLRHAIGKQKSTAEPYVLIAVWSSVGSRTLLVGGWLPRLVAVSILEVGAASIFAP
jgi:hypothetical protein